MALTFDMDVLPGGAFLYRPPEKIFTVEDFSSDDRLMIETAEQFSRKEVLSAVDRLQVQEEGLMPSLIRQAGELGLLGTNAPEKYGGLGLGKNLSARILEFLSLDASFSVTAGVTSGIGVFGLSWFGTDAQKAQYLPPVVSGEWLSAYCLSEPNSGSDALAASTRADERGGKWILNGTKAWVSNAKWANLFLVMAKIDGERFSAFLVERNFPGVHIEREELKMGLKGSSTARVTLDNAEVPIESLLYEPGQGHRVALNALNLGRFKLSAMSLGPARQAMREAAAYALDRKQFGSPISEFGLIQQKFATMAALFYVAESMIYRTGASIDAAFEAHPDTPEGNRKAAEEYAIECSACKVFATEAESWIVDEAFQVFGGYGFTEEFPIARHYRDARVSRIYEGTNEINRVFIASRLHKLAEGGRASLEAAGDSFISKLAGKAMAQPPRDQIALGAQSDLVLLAYAEQSARLRARQSGAWAEELFKVAVPVLNQRAAAAFQRVTGEAVLLPQPEVNDLAEIAGRVYEFGGPLGT
ncbi:MAG: acyl-CoA dehydrogenase family protein [Armatimonadetes bacterium]|nr:acyl-CoA dehydrogenase family protein [Armatimonadota bacterium]